MPDSIISSGKTRNGKDYVIRKYRPEDRERVRWICSETGFVGKPQEAIFLGREEFADLWSSYWTDMEPESAFVAEVEGQVEGYILGCLDTRRQEKIWTKKILPAVAKKMALPGWWKHSINRQYIRAMVRSYRRGEVKAPMHEILRDYPAHLHTNIGDPAFRGQGLGKGMMLALFDYLRENNIKGLHLGTTSHNREAVPFYEYMGFKVIWKNRATMYDHAIDDPPLYLLYMAREL